MKRILFLIVLTFFFTLKTEAQNKNKQRIKLLKTSFITDALNLTQDEAEKFWPIYNRHSNMLQRLKRELDNNLINQIKKVQGIENISEEEATVLLKKSITIEKNIAKTKEMMISDLSGFLSSKKLIKLQRAEREFNRQMLQEFSRRKRLQRQ